MGANQQITNVDTGLSAGTLELSDLSAMLGQWLDIVGMQRVSVMGMSLGSVVASGLADLRPELIDRMILMGVMQKTRKSWRMLLEESLFLMQEQRMEEFGQAVILYLVNHARLKEILDAIDQHPDCTAYETAGRISWSARGRAWEDFSPNQKWFAMGETLAHIKWLSDRGAISSTRPLSLNMPTIQNTPAKETAENRYRALCHSSDLCHSGYRNAGGVSEGCRFPGALRNCGSA